MVRILNLKLMKDQKNNSNFGRHYSALMRKNFINWKRTPLSSMMDLVLTVLICLLLNYKFYT